MEAAPRYPTNAQRPDGFMDDAANAVNDRAGMVAETSKPDITNYRQS